MSVRSLTAAGGKAYQKSHATKLRIFQAAAAVVARVGYPKASISKITEEAGVAAGLFYYYFKSKDDLLNQVLPAYGEQMIGVIGRRVRSLEMGMDRELAAFVAYFDFLRENPEFYRLFTEASVYSPVAYDAHIRLIMDNFAKSLRMQKMAGRIRLPEEDIVPLAYSLVGVRTYMTQLLMRDGRGFSKLPDQFVSVYAAILSGIFIHE